MVYENPYSQDKKSLNNKSLQLFAPPVDRILAVTFDLFFHAPIFTFFSFIIMYRFNLLKITVASTSEKMAVFFQLVWVFVVATVVMQAIYFKLFSKTPGMKIFKLELKSTSEATLSWNQCLLRSVVWCLELILLGIPLLGILSHSRRQALHDRVSETEIVSLKPWGALSPLPSEKSMVHMVLTMLIMLSLGWVTAMFSLTQKSIKEGTLALTEWREQGQICNEVDDLASYSKMNLSPISKRLDFAIGSYLFEQIDSSCLKKELDFALFKHVDGALVWVGRAYLSSPHTPENKAYQERACAEDSRWCQSSLFFEKSNIDQISALLNHKRDSHIAISEEFQKETIAFNAAKLILFNRIGADADAQNLVEKLQSLGLRATGLVAEHLKLTQRSNPDQLNLILKSLKTIMVEKDFLRLNADVCLRQLETGCSSSVSECSTMKSLLPSYKESLNDFVVSRALYKSAVCHNDLAEDMEYWTLISDVGLQKLISITEKVNSTELKLKGLVQLRNYIKDEGQKIELRYDALQLLLTQSNYEADWELLPALWKQFHWTEASYLSASEWFLSEAKKRNKVAFISEVKNTYTKIPGLKLAWNLYGSNIPSKRLPASLKGK